MKCDICGSDDKVQPLRPELQTDGLKDLCESCMKKANMIAQEIGEMTQPWLKEEIAEMKYSKPDGDLN